MPALIVRIGEWLPQGWGDLFRQLLLYLIADTGYEFARGMADGRANVAFANGERVMDVERSMGLFFEPGMQGTILNLQWMVDIANTIYLNSQFTVALAFLIWMYLFRNEYYYFFRNMLFVSMGLALVGYIGFPTAPPRMFPEYGFIDTVNAHSSVNHDSALAKLFINPFAAVPSMHCAVALMIGCTGFMVCRNWFARGFWAAWPLIVAWVTVVTANHYWVDAVLGWMVAGVSFLIAARVLAELKPETWAWSRDAERQRAEA
ncbi:MAG: phosphatase PAP2 family protein [Solirubrobacterales bacterium]|nr:phosphatase PAP2 family protein [Solirubrobacterales bacterium]HMT04484.1 phosphatase PAP2 family protein [Solirubrobacterales bacterium]